MFDFDELSPPSGDNSLDWENAEEVPDKVLQRFGGSTKSLGRSLKNSTAGTHVIRSRDGVTYVVPRILGDS